LTKMSKRKPKQW